MKVMVISSAQSDYDKMRKATSIIKKTSRRLEMLCGETIEVKTGCLSSHRALKDLILDIEKDQKGEEPSDVIIAGAGLSGALPGIIASLTVTPVIGVPLSSVEGFDGTDALKGMSLMPSGVPVAVVGINGSENAAYLALQILAIGHPKLKDIIEKYRDDFGAMSRASDMEIYRENLEIRDNKK